MYERSIFISNTPLHLKRKGYLNIMADVKYLKDKEGNIISPIVSQDSVFDAEGNTLTSKITSINETLGSMSTMLDTINGEVK